jgi:hypothetical protein
MKKAVSDHGFHRRRCYPIWAGDKIYKIYENYLKCGINIVNHL